MNKPTTPIHAAASLLALLALALATATPSHGEAPACPSGTKRYAEYRLFFGRSRGDIEVVSDADWREFLGEEVTPRFPDGLTVLDAAGQWRAPSGEIERERTKMLLVLAEPGAHAMRRTEAIAEAYKRRYGQGSVLRTVGSTCATF